ncbi:hypothetical protein ACLQ2R_18485 [Streptosporangium sp. DT93]|uniref:hypothetical protein n=1 Tax=Streptosporangium sp. DT93 TaxID=3393428 RepID=UPI003CF60473
MGKFEGMDPKLVRDLLSEVKQAADRMRDAEGRVTRLMSGAGLSSQTAHRPVQIADACDGMVRDVTARVALLEKRISQNATAPPAGPTAGDAKPDTGAQGDGTKPEAGSQGEAKKPGEEASRAEKPTGGGPDAAVKEPADRPRVGDQSAESAQRDDPKGRPETGAGSDSPRDHKGDSGSGGGAEEAKPQTGSKGDETSPRDGSPRTPEQGTDDRKPDSPGTDERRPDSQGAEDRKPDSQGADERRQDPQGTGDRKPDSQGADDRKPETGSKGDETSPRDKDTSSREVIRTDPGPEAPRGEEPRQQAPERDATPEPRAPERDATPEPRAPERDATPAPQVPERDSAPEVPRQDSMPEPPRQDSASEAPRQDSAPAPETPRADDARPQVPRVEDLKPAVPGPGEGGQNGGHPVDTAPREAPRTDTAPQAPEAPRQDSMPEPPRQDSAPAPQAPVPEAPGADAARPEIVDVNDRGPGAGDSTGTAPGNDPDAKGDPGTKGDERSPRQEGGTSGGPILDGPAKDHPDDIDQRDSRAKVVEVDGVKVLQIPLDSPTAAEVDELLKNIEDIPPLQMPSAESVSATAAQPGWVEPHGPLESARPDYPLLDTAGPTTDQTVQPPGTGGDSASGSTGTTSGEAPRPADSASAEPAVQKTGEGPPQPAPAPQAAGQAPSLGDALSAEAAETRPADGASDGQGRTADGAGAPGGSGDARPAESPAGVSAAWADDGDEVVTARAGLLDPDALRTLTENAREVEPLEMPGVRVPDGETWGEGAWVPMDVGPDGPAGDVDPADPVRPVPPPGGGR